MMLPKTLLNFLLPNATMQDISRLMPLDGVYSNNFRYFSSIPSTFARTTKTWYARRCQDRMQQASAVFIGCSSTFYISILFYLLHFKFKIRECPVDIAGHKTKGCLHVWVETWMTSETPTLTNFTRKSGPGMQQTLRRAHRRAITNLSPQKAIRHHLRDPAHKEVVQSPPKASLGSP